MTQRETNFGVIAFGPFEEGGIDAQVVYTDILAESIAKRKRRGRGQLA